MMAGTKLSFLYILVLRELLPLNGDDTVGELL
jgi:hypothetical protein